MFSGLAQGKVPTGSLRVRLVLKDIETLNRWAAKGRLETTALSFHAYAHVSGIYALLPCGASFGEGYGPVVVGRKKIGLRDLRKKTVAVPGTGTTAFLLLKIFLGEFPFKEVPFHKIPQAVSAGDYAAGLVIHEGQLTYKKFGLVKIMDLGKKWERETRLPLPLGANAVRKNLRMDVIRQVNSLLQKSIRWGFDNRDMAMATAMEQSRGTEEDLVDAFVRMYVNRYTLSYGPMGRKAVKALLRMGYERGHLPALVEPEFLPTGT